MVLLKMAVFRNKKSTYVQISNDVLYDTTLTRGAKGLYGEICSYINYPDFKLTKDYLMQKGQEKTEDFETLWEELDSKGFLKHFEERERRA